MKIPHIQFSPKTHKDIGIEVVELSDIYTRLNNFTHTNYNFFGPKVGFDVFRFENGLIVEHWDNLDEKVTTNNPSGRSQLDGATQVTDLDKTEETKHWLLILLILF